jgi:hypothetical protein
MINGMRTYLVVSLLSTIAAFAQNGAFEGHPAIPLSNDKLELLVLKQGASVASVILRDDPARLNPLWDPARMQRELNGRSNFSSGTGQFLCVDGFGGVSSEEKAAGLPGHGEAHLVEWESRLRDGQLVLTSQLPHTQESITRTMTLAPGENVVIYETTLTSQLDFDRPILWAEHATIGSPFLSPGVTVVDIPAVRSKTRPHEGRPFLPFRLPSDVEFTWPNSPTVDGKTVDLRAAPEQPNSGDHTASLIDPKRTLAFATAINPKEHLIVGWVFKPQEYPWVQNWENYPSTGKLARGLEFSTQPFDLPRRVVIDQNNLWGTPLYRWLPAKSKISTRFALFYAHTPPGMTHVDDVRWENGVLIVEDRASNKVLRLPMAAAL